MKIGIIGCGNIAKEIKNKFKINAVYDIYPEKCKEFKCKVCENIDELISRSDIVIEAASPQAVKEYALKIIGAGRSMVIMSIGGLIDKDFRERLFKLSREKEAKIYLPSGAIGAIDLIKTAKIAGIERILLKSTKNSKVLGYDVDERTLIFSGKASEAIKRYPKSVNVSVLLSIVSGMDIDVEIYADPEARENIHEIYVKGAFGEAEIKIKNRPSPQNPRTSYLAMLSPIYLLESFNSVVKMGV